MNARFGHVESTPGVLNRLRDNDGVWDIEYDSGPIEGNEWVIWLAGRLPHKLFSTKAVVRKVRPKGDRVYVVVDFGEGETSMVWIEPC